MLVFGISSSSECIFPPLVFFVCPGCFPAWTTSWSMKRLEMTSKPCVASCIWIGSKSNTESCCVTLLVAGAMCCNPEPGRGGEGSSRMLDRLGDGAAPTLPVCLPASRPLPNMGLVSSPGACPSGTVDHGAPESWGAEHPHLPKPRDGHSAAAIHAYCITTLCLWSAMGTMR